MLLRHVINRRSIVVAHVLDRYSTQWDAYRTNRRETLGRSAMIRIKLGPSCTNAAPDADAMD